MNNQRIELRLGLMVLFATGFLIYMAVLFGKPSLFNFGSDYKIVVRFDSAPGLVLGTSVFKNGVKIGQVGSVQLVDEDREVQVILLIHSGRKIYTNEECTIKSPAIMGETTVEFVRKKDYSGPIELIVADGEPIIGAVPGDIFGSLSDIEGEMTVAIRKVSDAAGELADFMSRISMFVGSHEEIEEKQQRLDTAVNQAMDTMNSIGTLTKNVNDFVSDPAINAQIRDAVAKTPVTMEKMQVLIVDTNTFLNELRTNFKNFDGTLVRIDDALAKINKTLDSVDPFTQALGNDGPQITASLRKSADKLGGFFDELTGLVGSVRESDGTIMKLLKDDELYGNIKQVVYNVEELSGDLRPAVAELQPMLRNARPIVDNAKVFTDKLARDPSAIVSGLVRRQPPVKGGLPQWGDGLGSDGMCARDLAMVRQVEGYAPVCGGAGLAGRNTPIEMPKRNCFTFWWPFGKKQTNGDEGGYYGEHYVEQYGEPYGTFDGDGVETENGVNRCPWGNPDCETRGNCSCNAGSVRPGSRMVGQDRAPAGRRYATAYPEEYPISSARQPLRPSQGHFEMIDGEMEIDGMPFEPLGPMLGTPNNVPAASIGPGTPSAPMPDLGATQRSTNPQSTTPVPISAQSTAAARPLMDRIPFPQPPPSKSASPDATLTEEESQSNPVLTIQPVPQSSSAPLPTSTPRLVFTNDANPIR